jgi:hypothetical protein
MFLLLLYNCLLIIKKKFNFGQLRERGDEDETANARRDSHEAHFYGPSLLYVFSSFFFILHHHLARLNPAYMHGMLHL